MAAIYSRTIALSVGGTSYSDAATNARLTVGDADSDTITFADAAAGGLKLFKLALSIIQDLAAASLFRKMYDAPGTTTAFLLKWYGNATASTTQPHSSGNAIMTFPDGDLLGGAASISTTAKLTTDVEWDCTAQPTLVTS